PPPSRRAPPPAPGPPARPGRRRPRDHVALRRRVPPPRCLSAVGRVGMMAAMTDHAGAGRPNEPPAPGDPDEPGGRGHSKGLASGGDPGGAARAARHAVEAFVAHLRDERGLSGHTVAAYRRDLIQFLQFAGRAGATDPGRVEPLLLRRLLTPRAEQGA